MPGEFESVLLTVSELRRLECSDADIVEIAYPDPDLRPVSGHDPDTGTAHLVIAMPGHVCVATLGNRRCNVEVRMLPGRGIVGLWRRALALGRPIVGTVVARDSGTAWPSSDLEDASRWSDGDERDALSRVTDEMAIVTGPRPPSTSKLLGTLLPAAARRVLLDTAMRDMEPDAARLAALATERVSPRPIDTDDLVALAACARVRHPGRVAEALARHPLLACLFDRPWSAGDAHNEALDRIAEGVPPLQVCRELLDDGRNGRSPMRTAAVRSLASARLSVARDAREAVVRFHSRHQSHRAIDGDETRAVAAAVAMLDVTVAIVDVPVVASLLHRGRVLPLPDGYVDAHHDLVSALGSLFKANGMPDAMWARCEMATRLAFTPRRDWDGLRRVTGEWHRTVQALAARRAAVFDRARMRMAGRVVEEAASKPFPHLAPARMDMGGVEAVPLLSHADYLAEGGEMGHCVASQGDDGLRATKCALSLRSADGARSTLSLAVDDRGFPAVVEHRGPGNSDPTVTHSRAVPTILAGIVARRGAVDAFVAARSERASWTLGGGNMDSLDDMERAAVIEVDFARIRPWLSRSEAAPGPAEWLRRAHPDMRAGGAATANLIEVRGYIPVSVKRYP